MTHSIPKEVLKQVNWFFHKSDDPTYTVDPGTIFFCRKDIDRSTAWDMIATGIEAERNPWRKCHTKNYWVWVIRP